MFVRPSCPQCSLGTKLNASGRLHASQLSHADQTAAVPRRVLNAHLPLDAFHDRWKEGNHGSKQHNRGKPLSLPLQHSRRDPWRRCPSRCECCASTPWPNRGWIQPLEKMAGHIFQHRWLHLPVKFANLSCTMSPPPSSFPAIAFGRYQPRNCPVICPTH